MSHSQALNKDQREAQVLKLRYSESFRNIARPGGPVVVSQRRNGKLI